MLHHRGRNSDPEPCDAVLRIDCLRRSDAATNGYFCNQGDFFGDGSLTGKTSEGYICTSFVQASCTNIFGRCCVGRHLCGLNTPSRPCCRMGSSPLRFGLFSGPFLGSRQHMIRPTGSPDGGGGVKLINVPCGGWHPPHQYRHGAPDCFVSVIDKPQKSISTYGGDPLPLRPFSTSPPANVQLTLLAKRL